MEGDKSAGIGRGGVLARTPITAPAAPPAGTTATTTTSSSSNNNTTTTNNDAATRNSNNNGENNNTTANSSDLVVWVLGGGFAGLACAAALRRLAGIEKVVVLEALDSDEYNRETAGAVAKVTPNGLRALAVLDPALPSRVVAAGAKLTGVAVLEETSDSNHHQQQQAAAVKHVMRDDPEPATGWPQVLIRWSALRRLLQDLIDPPESVVTGIGYDVCGYAVDEDSGTVQLVDEHGAPVVRRDRLPARLRDAPHLIVAADGVNSPFQSLVRSSSSGSTTVLCGPDAAAIRKSNVHDNGRVNVNAVTKTACGNVPISDDKNSSSLNLPPGTALAYHAPDHTFTCFCAAAGQGYTSWALSLQDAVDEAGSRLCYFAQCDDRHLPAVRAFLVVFLAERPGAPDWIRRLVAATPAEALFVRRSQQLTVVGPTFVSRDARVVLAGDAAHAMSPSYGQATSFALEDAVVLALAVQRHCGGGDSGGSGNSTATLSHSRGSALRRALHAYSALRVHRCEEMFRRSAVRVHRQRAGQAVQADDVLPWINGWEVPGEDDILCPDPPPQQQQK